MKNKSILIFAILIICLTSCSSKNYNKEELDTLSKYVAITSDNNTKKCSTNILFLDEEGNILDNEEIKTDSDISYNYFNNENNTYYKYGPGGLIEISLDDLSVEILSEKDISEVHIDNNEIYYYENQGKVSYIKKVNSDFSLKLNYHIASFQYYKEKLYVLESNSENKTYIHIYEDQELIESKDVETSGNFYIINNQLYLLTNRYLLDVETNQKYYLKNESNDFYLANTYNCTFNTNDGIILFDSKDNENVFYRMQIENSEVILEKVYTATNKFLVNIQYQTNWGFILTTKDNEAYNIELFKDEIISHHLDFNFDALDKLDIIFLRK